MKNRKLASRYARALLDAIPDPAQSEVVEQFLTALADAMQASRELRDHLLDPAVPRSSRKKAMALIAERHQMPPRVVNFLYTVVDHGRTADLPLMAEVYREMRLRQAGVVSATITTAVPLEDALRQRARQALERLTGHKVDLKFRVEPSLIGGAMTQIGSTIYDGSLRTQLTRLRRRMVQE